MSKSAKSGWIKAGMLPAAVLFGLGLAVSACGSYQETYPTTTRTTTEQTTMQPTMMQPSTATTTTRTYYAP
jgi:hypothetical protein